MKCKVTSELRDIAKILKTGKTIFFAGNLLMNKLGEYTRTKKTNRVKNVNK